VRAIEGEDRDAIMADHENISHLEPLPFKTSQVEPVRDDALPHQAGRRPHPESVRPGQSEALLGVDEARRDRHPLNIGCI